MQDGEGVDFPTRPSKADRFDRREFFFASPLGSGLWFAVPKRGAEERIKQVCVDWARLGRISL